MIKQNLGKLDRVLRFALAFWWLVLWGAMGTAEQFTVGKCSYCCGRLDCFSRKLLRMVPTA